MNMYIFYIADGACSSTFRGKPPRNVVFVVVVVVVRSWSDERALFLVPPSIHYALYVREGGVV